MSQSDSPVEFRHTGDAVFHRSCLADGKKRAASLFVNEKAPLLQVGNQIF